MRMSALFTRCTLRWTPGITESGVEHVHAIRHPGCQGKNETPSVGIRRESDAVDQENVTAVNYGVVGDRTTVFEGDSDRGVLRDSGKETIRDGW